MHFTKNAMAAIQEASEMFVTETFHKADLARVHAGRETLNVKDIRFSRFMVPESLWVVPAERVWEKNIFSSTSANAAADSAANIANKKRNHAKFFDSVDKMQKKLEMKKKRKQQQAKAQVLEQESQAEEEQQDDKENDNDKEEQEDDEERLTQE